MARRKAAAPAREISAAEAASLVRNGMWLDYGFGLSQPDVFDRALGERIDAVRDVKFRSCLSLRPRAILDRDPTGEHAFGFSWHYSGYDRKMSDLGRMGYIPVNLGEIPDYYRRNVERVDIAIIKTRPMDDSGYFNFGGTNVWHRAIVEKADIVIVETTEGLPWTFGNEGGIHVSEVDFIVRGDDAPAVEAPNPPASAIDRAVAQFIAGEIEDGACLQIGIGGMPNAVCAALKDSGARDLGVHTEMLTDGIADLYKAGLITSARKQMDVGRNIYSFVLGTKPLYDVIDRNPDFDCRTVDYSNSPHVIMRNDKVFSINNTTQIDLQGQCASESDGHRHISGTGGQLQFVRGAYASNGGKSFICLSSTYDKRGAPRSRIVLDLTQGNIVTTPRSDTMYVVTEYGIVNLKGKSVAERARGLISIAHPDFREELERQAFAAKLLPRHFTF